MTDGPEANAAAFEEPTPPEGPGVDHLTMVDGGVPDAAEVGRRQRFADIAVAVSFVVKVSWFMVVTRGWFYIADDWDYLTRSGFGRVFDPHTDHLTAIVSAYAIALRPLIGFDYWPGYAILAGVSWPIVGVAAYWVWRRRRLNPVVAASAAIFLMWMGTAGWVQYGHAGAGLAIAATIVAIDIDQRRLSAGNVSLSLGLTALATVASTSGAIGAVGRLIAALVRRKWTGVAATAPVVAGYVWYRAYHGSTADPIFGIGDIFTSLGVASQVLGDGMLLVIPWSSDLSWVLGLGLIIAAVAAVVVSRFSYATMAFVALGAGHVLSVAVFRYLGRPARLELLRESGINLEIPASPRYTMVFTTVLLVATVPLFARWFSTRRRTIALIAATAVLVGIGAYHTAGRFELITDRSAIIAPRVAAHLTLLERGEPAIADGKRIDPLFGNALTYESMQWMVDEGLDTSLLASDVYRRGDLEVAPLDATRGRMRLNLSRGARLEGTWSDLGEYSRDRCRPFTSAQSFEVLAPVLYRLELAAPDPPLVIRWVDEFGEGYVNIGDHFTEVDQMSLVDENVWQDPPAIVNVKTAAPAPGSPPPVMTIEAADGTSPIELTMCMVKSPRVKKSKSGG